MKAESKEGKMVYRMSHTGLSGDWDWMTEQHGGE